MRKSLYIICMMQVRETKKIISCLKKAKETKTLSSQKTRKKKCKTKEERGPVIMMQGKPVAEDTEKIS